VRQKFAVSLSVLLILTGFLIFSGCGGDDGSYSGIVTPSLNKELVIQGTLPDVASGGGISFAPSAAPARAADFGGLYTISVIDRDDPSLQKELTQAVLSGNSFSATIPISNLRKTPFIVIREKASNRNILSVMPGRVPAYNELPPSVRQIIIRGLTLNSQSTARAFIHH